MSERIISDIRDIPVYNTDISSKVISVQNSLKCKTSIIRSKIKLIHVII